MSVNTFVRIDLRLAHQIDFAIGGEIKTGAFALEYFNHPHVRQGLKRIVQGYARQGGNQGAVLMAHGCLIQNQQG